MYVKERALLEAFRPQSTLLCSIHSPPESRKQGNFKQAKNNHTNSCLNIYWNPMRVEKKTHLGRQVSPQPPEPKTKKIGEREMTDILSALRLLRADDPLRPDSLPNSASTLNLAQGLRKVMPWTSQNSPK